MTTIPRVSLQPGFRTFPCLSALAIALSAAVVSPGSLAQAEFIPTSADQTGYQNALTVDQQGGGQMSATVYQSGESNNLTAGQSSVEGATLAVTVRQEGSSHNASVVQSSENGSQQVVLLQSGNQNEANLQQTNTQTLAAMQISQDGALNNIVASQVDSSESTLTASQVGDGNSTTVYLEGGSNTTIYQEGNEQILLIDRQTSNLTVNQAGIGNITELSVNESDGPNDFFITVNGEHNVLRLNAEIATLYHETPLQVTQTGNNNLAELDYQGVILLTSEINQSGDNNTIALSVTDGTWVTANINQEWATSSVVEMDLSPFRSLRTYVNQSSEGGSISVYDYGSENTDQTLIQEGIGGQINLHSSSTEGSVITVMQQSSAPGNVIDIQINGGLSSEGGGATETMDIHQLDVASSTAIVNQNDIEGTQVRILQSGGAAGNENLYAEITQINPGFEQILSAASIEQSGLNQLASIHQESFAPYAQILQSGSGNTAHIEQFASDSAQSASISQTGEGHLAEISQH